MVPFPYISKAHIKISVNGNPANFSWVTDNTVQLTQPLSQESTIVIVRDTPKSQRLVDFVDGAILKESDLDIANIQLLYAMQETIDYTKDVIIFDPALGYFDAKGCRITNTGTPIEENDVITLKYFNEVITPQINQYVHTKMQQTAHTMVENEIAQIQQELLDILTQVQNIAIQIESDRTLVTTTKNEVLSLKNDTQTLHNQTEQLKNETQQIKDSTVNFIHKGEYNSSIPYVKNNIVSKNGSSYVLVADNGAPGIGEPGIDTSNWQMIGKKGDKGDPGPEGRSANIDPFLSCTHFVDTEAIFNAASLNGIASNGNGVVLACTNYKFFKSTNHGETFSEINVPVNSEKVKDIIYGDGEFIIHVDPNYVSKRSSDNGETWQNISNNPNLKNAWFVKYNPENKTWGLLSATKYLGIMKKSEYPAFVNYGEIPQIDSIYNTTDIYIADKNNILLTRSEKPLLYTKNGGQNWLTYSNNSYRTYYFNSCVGFKNNSYILLGTYIENTAPNEKNVFSTNFNISTPSFNQTFGMFKTTENIHIHSIHMNEKDFYFYVKTNNLLINHICKINKHSYKIKHITSELRSNQIQITYTGLRHFLVCGNHAVLTDIPIE